jgi:hypothetical protein
VPSAAAEGEDMADSGSQMAKDTMEDNRRICRRVNKNCSHAHVSIPSLTTYIGVTHDDSRSQSRSNCPT